MEINGYIAYVLIATGYIASPGPAVFLAINGGASLGVKTTALILLGNTIGLGVLAFLSALGLGALILNSATLTVTVKIAGACWLAYLGIKMMKSDFTKQPTPGPTEITGQRRLLARFNDGLMLALTNPKPIIFFVSIYPQFVATDEPVFRQFLLLGATFMMLSFVLLNFYALISNNTVGKVLNRNRAIAFNVSFGLLFIILAVLLIIPIIIGE